MTRSRLITREARVEHTVELGCTIAGIFDFLRLCGNGIVDRLLDRNRTEPIPSEPFESARRCIGESTDLRAPHADKCMEIDPKGSVAARRQTPERVAFDRPWASGDARTGARRSGLHGIGGNEGPQKGVEADGALGPRFTVAAAVRPFDRMVSRARTSRLSLCDEDRQSDVLADPPVRQAIKTFSDWPTIPRSTSGAPSSGAATSCSKCTRQANLRKHSASIAPWLHHDRPDGHKVGASGAIRGDIWRPTFVGPCAVGASDPAPGNRSTQMTSFMPTLMPTLRTARLLTILLLPVL